MKSKRLFLPQMLPVRLCVRYVRTLARGEQPLTEEAQTKQVQRVEDGAFTVCMLRKLIRCCYFLLQLELSTSTRSVERQLLDTYERKLFPDEADVERVRFPAREPQTTMARIDHSK